MKNSDPLIMRPFFRGRYSAALAASDQEVSEAQTLRGVCFGLSEQDIDAFDASSIHVLIRRLDDNQLMACFRMFSTTGAQIDSSYSAQYYDLTALSQFHGQMVELGRFCIDPSERDPDILRVAWAAMTAYVDQNNVKMLFGCTSFAGVDADAYQEPFALLKDRHLAPNHWRPKAKGSEIIPFENHEFDGKRAMSQMPPLLRTYLLMGGWVSDHAVVDHHLNTMHVFTGVEIAAIPDTRKRLLRAVVDI